MVGVAPQGCSTLGANASSRGSGSRYLQEDMFWPENVRVLSPAAVQHSLSSDVLGADRLTVFCYRGVCASMRVVWCVCVCLCLCLCVCVCGCVFVFGCVCLCVVLVVQGNYCRRGMAKVCCLDWHWCNLSSAAHCCECLLQLLRPPEIAPSLRLIAFVVCDQH
jgi:hypothetical protein